MSSKKLSNNQVTLATQSSRVVKFTAAAADQTLLQAIETALEDGCYRSFSDLCKRALRQLLLSSAQTATPEKIAPDTSLMLLQQQMLLLQQQVAHLEGALGMKQIISLNRLEQQIAQLDQRTAEQSTQFSLRLDRLEAVTSPAATGEPLNCLDLDSDSSDLAVIDSASDPLLSDPLLSRLMPLLEDF